ncbi:hypothetical protein N8592_03135 [Verrucomicrobia bacterium]|nr:hypothetical protein [Verrucomicrobiota bacterium]
MPDKASRPKWWIIVIIGLEVVIICYLLGVATARFFLYMGWS